MNRTVAMINKYFNGEIQTIQLNETEYDRELMNVASTTREQVEEALENMQFSVALSTLWQFISRTNKYIDERTLGIGKR